MDKEYLELNAKLQKKKSALRKELKARGILKRGAVNKFDNYMYFSEAQYKELFTELFPGYGLELSFTELAYELIDGSGKNTNGRLAKIMFSLTDTDTGFAEQTTITGEGMDKGDKAGYKAFTGALKYYLANTFMVATGDDPEKESPTEKMNTKDEAAINDDLTKPATERERKQYMDECDKRGLDAIEVLKSVGWTGGRMTKAQWAKAMYEATK